MGCIGFRVYHTLLQIDMEAPNRIPPSKGISRWLGFRVIVPLKEIECGFGYKYNKVPKYPIFYLLKGTISVTQDGGP